MKGLPFVLMFTAMTFVSWGVYGPILHHGAEALDHDSMRAFVGVGLAYFMIAVLIPFGVLKKSGETGRWTASGTIYSVVAGAVGAIGALGIILALGYGGRTVYVMPLVFGFAPVVNTLVTAYLSKTFNQISPVFLAGIAAAALGAAGVLVFKPSPAAAKAEGPALTPVAFLQSATEGDEPSSEAEGEKGNAAQESAEEATDANPPEETVTDGSEAPAADAAEATKKASTNVIGIIFSIIIAALCWGSYGPMLHIGQAKMEGSRLRPFACVGIAYFLIAVIAPLVLIFSRSVDAGAWTASGMTWSFLAGVAGAIGALGVILAFNAGGKPYYVMPLIFGFAPVINTFVSLSEAGTWGNVQIMFWVSLAVVIAGAATVLTNAPRPKPKAAPVAEPKPAL